jgi:hypothetical protein
MHAFVKRCSAHGANAHDLHETGTFRHFGFAFARVFAKRAGSAGADAQARVAAHACGANATAGAHIPAAREPIFVA